MIERSLKPKRRWPRVVLSAFVCALALFIGLLVYLLLIKGPQVPQGPIRMVRGPDGRLAPAEATEQGPGLSLEALAANTRSSDSISAAASTVSSANTRFACRRLLILNRSDHLLMQRMGPRLLEHLANLNCADAVDYSPDGRVATAGGPAPDVVITLDLPSVHETGSLTGSRLTATVVATAGNSLTAGRSDVVDDMTPPSLRFHWQATLEHESVTTGIASRSAKFKPQADDIARQLGDALVKLINGYHDKYGPMPELPAAFYPAYTPTGPLPFLDGYTLQPIASWRGLLTSNDSCWLLSAPASALADIRQKTQAAGWRVDPPVGGNASPTLHATRGDALLSIFPAERDGDYYVHYVLHMPHDEFEAAVGATLTDSAPTDVLLLFSGSWSDAQRTRALGLLRSRQLTTAEANLSVAEMCQSAGRDSQAREALDRAAALLLVTPDPGELTTRARGIARRLNAEKALDAPPTRATMLAAGFRELPADGQTVERELALDEPALFFIREPEGKTSAASVLVVRAASGICQVAYVGADDDGKSWGRTGGITEAQDTHLTLLRGRADITIARKPAQDRFLLTVRALKRKP